MRGRGSSAGVEEDGVEVEGGEAVTVCWIVKMAVELIAQPTPTHA